MLETYQMLTRPDRSEYADFYANYIARVPDGDVIVFLSTQPGAYRKLLGSLSAEAASARPQPGKWNVKEIIGHLCDAERVQSYRALRFARGDQKELHGFEQDDYVRAACRTCSMNFRESATRRLRSSSPSRRRFGSAPASPTVRRLRCAPWRTLS